MQQFFDLSERLDDPHKVSRNVAANKKCAISFPMYFSLMQSVVGYCWLKYLQGLLTAVGRGRGQLLLSVGVTFNPSIRTEMASIIGPFAK